MVLLPGCKCCGGGDWFCFFCQPYLIHAFEIESDGITEECYDLYPYVDVGIANAGRPWRLVEVGEHCDGFDPGDDEGYITWHNAGYVKPNGILDLDPPEFCSLYPYKGFMRLQLGCDHPDYAGDPWAAIYNDDCTEPVLP